MKPLISICTALNSMLQYKKVETKTIRLPRERKHEYLLSVYVTRGTIDEAWKQSVHKTKVRM